MANKLPTDEFTNKAKLVHGDKYDYSNVEYVNSKTKVKIICPEHGEFEQIPNNHLNGANCYLCGRKAINNHNTGNVNIFIHEALKLYGDKYNYSLVKYVNSKTKVKIICPIHGEFEQTPDNHIRSGGCNYCGQNTTTTKNSNNINIFIDMSNKKHNFIYDYSNVNYKNNHTKVNIICKTHGEFKQRPNDHLKGVGCPICNNSKGEMKIRLFLEENNIRFNTQYRFSDCKNIRPLPFDFYLPEHNICIEFNGRQHYEPLEHFGGIINFKKQQINDKIKYNFCKSSNISLIIINYRDINNINKILSKSF